ncbi:MAG: 5-formyltetrahydrofolate cyclo-ligase [candidate division WOR-3 bacterium]
MTKEEIRHKVWRFLEENDLVNFPRPCFGRIPNFKDAYLASQRLRSLPEFQTAKGIFSAPDGVLKEARRITLQAGKVLIVALPHMTDFLEIAGKEFQDKAITINGFRRYGKPPKTEVEIFLQGSVAVDLKGNRLGKGKGYGDKEYEILKAMGLIKKKPTVITIVHDCQVFEDFSYLKEPHDIRVDVILTPTRVIRTK